MKYIDSEKLIAEIERLQKFSDNMADNAINSNMRNFYDGEEDCCKQLLSLITSLQQEQPEVDLEREIRDYFSKWDYDSYHCVITMDNDIVATLSSIQNVARHFYELGNARKEE